MNVQYPSGKLFDEFSGQDPHESRERDQRRRILGDRGGQDAIVAGAFASHRSRHRSRLDTKLPRDIEAPGIGPIREYRGHGVSSISRLAALDESPHIAAAPRYQDDDRLPRRLAQAMTTPRVPVRT